MAQIRTINGEMWEVKQTKDEIDNIIYNSERIDTSVICLDLLVISSKKEKDQWGEGEIIEVRQYELATFIRSNIMLYY